MTEACPVDGNSGFIWSSVEVISKGATVHKYSFNKCSQCELFFGVQLSSHDKPIVSKSASESRRHLDKTIITGNHSLSCPCCQGTSFTNYNTKTLYIKNYDAMDDPEIRTSEPSEKIIDQFEKIIFRFYLCNDCDTMFYIEQTTPIGDNT